MSKRTRLSALIFFLLTTIGLVAQSLRPVPTLVQQLRNNDTPFTSFQLFQKTNTQDAAAARFAQAAQFLRLQLNQYDQLLAQKPKAITIQLPYNGELLWVDLVQVQLVSPDFVRIYNNKEERAGEIASGVHYRGHVQGDLYSIAALSFYKEEVFGFVSDRQHNNLVLGRVQTPGNSTGYMLYSDLELAMDSPLDCILLEPGVQKTSNQKTGKSSSKKTIRLALEADYALVRKMGGPRPVTAYMLALFNQTASIYANDGVSLLLSELRVPIAPQYDLTAGATAVLRQFSATRINTSADLHQLLGLSNAIPESITYLDGLCSSEYSVAYCALEPVFSHVPTHAWTAAIMAHELGHQLGAQHTQWCGWKGGAIEGCSGSAKPACQKTEPEDRARNTMMSYCQLSERPVSFQAGLGPLPGQLVRDRIQAANCLQVPNANRPVSGRQSGTADGVLSLVPNPAQEQVQVNIDFQDRLITRIAVLDLLGRTVRTLPVQLDQGSIKMDLSGMPKGVYLVQSFERDALVATSRLIKE